MFSNMFKRFNIFKKGVLKMSKNIRTPFEMVNLYPHIRLDQLIYQGEPCIDNMTSDTLDLFNTLCRDAERHNLWSHRINSSYRPKSVTGQHSLGRAIDVVFFITEPGDIDVWEQYRFAKKYPWGGIGVYPFWNAPGLHLDSRQGWNHIALWWRDATNHDHSMAEATSIFGVMV